MPDGPLALVGGSIGAAVAQTVLCESGADVDAVVLISPVVQLSAVVEAMSKRFNAMYQWSDASRETARRMDFVARAEEVARTHAAVKVIAGADDDSAGFLEPAAALREALAGRYADPGRVDLATIAGMGHALAEEPGIEPAPQAPQAVEADRIAVEWLRRYLVRK